MVLAKHIKGADMRIQSVNQRYFDFSEPSSLKVVQAYRQKIQTLSELLDANPRLLVLAHRDWAKLLSCSNKGRRAKFTTEQLLRALIVKFVEQCSYRKTTILIDGSEFLRHFVRLESGSRGQSPDFSILLSAERRQLLSSIFHPINIPIELARSIAIPSRHSRPRKALCSKRAYLSRQPWGAGFAFCTRMVVTEI